MAAVREHGDNNSLDITDNFQLSMVLLSPMTTWNFIVFLCISIIGAIVNVLLLNAIAKDPLKCFRHPSTYFIANLAVGNFIGCLYHVEELVLSRTKYKSTTSFSGVWSIVHAALGSFPFFVSYPSVAALALERFISISYPLWHQVHLTRSVCRSSLALIWFVTCLNDGVYVYAIRHDLLSLATILLGYPYFFYLFAVVMYLLAYCSLRKRRLSLTNQVEQSESVRRMMEVRLKNESCFLSTVCIVNVFLVFGILPYIYFSVGYLTALDTRAVGFSVSFYVMDCLLLANMAVNPFLYVWRSPSYRKTFLKWYCYAI